MRLIDLLSTGSSKNLTLLKYAGEVPHENWHGEQGTRHLYIFKDEQGEYQHKATLNQHTRQLRHIPIGSRVTVRDDQWKHGKLTFEIIPSNLSL